jgi:tripartite-type tricarboxylate transporter receptor subunit TctC
MGAAGRAKALATSSPERNPDLADVPTMKELGLGELSLEFWAGMWAPAGLPADITGKLNAAINEALQDAQVRNRFRELQLITAGGSLAETKSLIEVERVQWGEVVRAAGIQPE